MLNGCVQDWSPQYIRRQLRLQDRFRSELLGEGGPSDWSTWLLHDEPRLVDRTGREELEKRIEETGVYGPVGGCITPHLLTLYCKSLTLYTQTTSKSPKPVTSEPPVNSINPLHFNNSQTHLTLCSPTTANIWTRTSQTV